jgi:citrate lyase subunit beta/citryl-CoA lyase
LLAIIESALGLVQAPPIAAACPRLVGLMFGAEDFALDLGIFSTGEGATGEMLYARSALVVAAASAHVQAVDKVYLDVRNPDGLAGETRRARELGFTGKAVIHPEQIEVVHRIYRPTDEEVEGARRVVDAFEASEGEGSIAVDGRMVDLPIVERARRILELHKEAS